MHSTQLFQCGFNAIDPELLQHNCFDVVYNITIPVLLQHICVNSLIANNFNAIQTIFSNVFAT